MYPGEPGRATGGGMDPGEQTTGTRDEHYNLISVLYHALHGAENCNTYALDAEAIGGVELADFFREAGAVQAQLAERAKELLGIGGAVAGAAPLEAEVAPDIDQPQTEVPPEGELVDVRGRAAPEVGFPPEGEASPVTTPEDITPPPTDVQREPNIPMDEAGVTAEEVPSMTEGLRTPGEEPPEIPGGVPPEGAAPGTEGVAREAPPPGEERPERREAAPSTQPDTREEPPPGEERPERRTP